MGAQHVGLLFYSEVRWLSKGKCLSLLYELKNEVEIFEKTKTTSMSNLIIRICCDAYVPGRCIRPPHRYELVFARP